MQDKITKKERDLRSMSGLGYIQSSHEFLIFLHIYNCPPPGEESGEG